jgi:hypothetical protein
MASSAGRWIPVREARLEKNRTEGGARRSIRRVGIRSREEVRSNGERRHRSPIDAGYKSPRSAKLRVDPPDVMM